MEEKKINVTRNKTNRVEVLLLPAVYEQLKNRATKEGLTMTSIIKLALKEYLAK